MNNKDIIPLQNTSIAPLVEDLRQIINQSRSRVAANVNAELTLMYWHIGERINREVLGNERVEYGKQIVATVSQQLQDRALPALARSPRDGIRRRVTSRIIALHRRQRRANRVTEALQIWHKKVAQYMTELPYKELQQRQLHKGLEAAKAHWDNRIEE